MSIIDPVNRGYYFRTQNNLNVHLDKIDYQEGAERTSFNIYGGNPFIDVTEKATKK